MYRTLFFLTEWTKLGEQWLCRHLTSVKFVAWVKRERQSHESKTRSGGWQQGAGVGAVLCVQGHEKRVRSKSIFACAYFAHAVCKTATSRTQNKHEKASFANCIKNQLFSIQVRKSQILSSCKRLRPSEARVKRPHENKITFSLVYQILFFYTTCGKINLGHASLFKRARKRTSRTSVKK